MKIACISDTHSKHYLLTKADFQDANIVVHAGDFTSSGSLNQTVEFLQWYESLDIPHKVLIAGNHDRASTLPAFHDILLKYAPSVTYLCNSSATVAGVKFWGSPYSNIFGSWSWMDEEEELTKIWDTIPLDTHVVVTHGPPHNYGDKVNNDWSATPYVGSTSLTETLQTLPNLRAHICGHIHENQGITLGDFISVNASSSDEHYRLKNSPIILTIKD